MFELIGLLVGTVIFFALSIFMGGVYALLASLILGQCERHKRYLFTFAAALLPPLFAVHIAVCSIGFSIFIPGESGKLFGDISEPLPNGYVLEALGKMPDYGHIELSSSTSLQPLQGFQGYIGRVAVNGPLVFGAYSHKYIEMTQEISEDRGYFVLDTQHGTVRNFDTFPQLDNYAGYPVQLTETQFFRSQEVSHKCLLMMERIILFGPPLVGTLVYFSCLFHLRRKLSLVADSVSSSI